MELKVDRTLKNLTSNTTGSFLPEQKCLKKFTIPKRTPDKDFLMECSSNHRDYGEIKQRLSQSCLDTECNLESLWHFDKIEIVHNKDLEEEFVAKRSKLREEGKQDKELSSFLVVSKDEVLKICQSGLHTNHSTKKELSIMKELGNPHLGVYLFRYVDIALNYASKHCIQVEYVIIFRVLLGKVKKIQPPKGKKKVALDPTPNFDCHISRIHPSVKDSVEDQAIGSLVYFYEYSELSKPVDKPRQCLPYAVVKVKCINQKVGAESCVTSLKSRPKHLPNFEGRRRGLPLENCTRVTRIGKNKLIYEHFRKPEEICAVNSENKVSAKVSSFSGSTRNWNSPIAETQCGKITQKLNRKWDSAQMETNGLNPQGAPGIDICRDDGRDYTGNSNQNPLKAHPGVASVYNSRPSTVITSRLIKDPRLTKREQNLEKENGEAIFHDISQSENDLQCNSKMKTSTSLGIPYPLPDEFILLNNSKPPFSQKQYMEKTSWKERTLEECMSPSLLNRNKYCIVSGEQGLDTLYKLNKEILPFQNTHADPTLKAYLSYNSLKSKDYENLRTMESEDSNGILAEDFKREIGMKQSKVPSSLLLNPSKTLGNEWKSQESQPVSRTTHDKKQELNPESAFSDGANITICNQIPESVTSGKDEIDNGGKMGSRLQDEDGYTSEIKCSTDLDTKYVKNNCASSEGERNGSCKTDNSAQDHIPEAEFCRKNNLFENMMKGIWAEDRYQAHKACQDDGVMKSLSEKSLCLPEQGSSDKHVPREIREYPLHLGMFIDGQSGQETNNVTGTSGFDQIHTCQFEETSHCEERSRRYIPEVEVPSATEKAEKTGRGQYSVDRDLRSLGDIKDWVDISEYSDILDSESSTSDFALNFQGKCSLTESQLMEIESGREKLRDLQDLSLLTECTGPTMHLEKNDTACMLVNPIPVPLRNLKQIEVESLQSENTDDSNANRGLLLNRLPCKDSVPEMIEQDLEVICVGTNIRDLEITSEIETTSQSCKKYLPVSQKPGSHGKMSDEETEYCYLQNRIDWENLFGKLSLNTQVSGRPSVKENENEYLGRTETGVEEEAELFNTSVWPDLQITITNIFQPRVSPVDNSLRTKTEMGKYSGRKKSIKWSQKEKCTDTQKKTKLHHRKKEHNTPCSSEIVSSLPEGPFQAFEQSEKHIKNLLNTFNTEAWLCKNKRLSQKIDGAMFHLRKAQRSFQKSVKCVAKAGKKKKRRCDSSHKVLCNDALGSCDPEGYSVITAEESSTFSERKRPKMRECKSSTEKKKENKKTQWRSGSNGDMKQVTTRSLMETKSDSGFLPLDSSVASCFISDRLCGNVNVRKIRKAELETVCEKSSSLDTVELQNLKPASDEHVTNNELALYQAEKRKGEGTFESDVDMSTVNLATPVQTTLEASKPNDISKLSPVSKMQENRKHKSLAKAEKQPENSTRKVLSPIMPLDNSLLLSSNHCALQEPQGGKWETEISKTKNDSSNVEPYLMQDIPVKPPVKVALEQKDVSQTSHLTHSEESPCSHISSINTGKPVKLQSPLITVTEQGIGGTATTDILLHACYDALPTETNKNVTTPGSRLNEKCPSGEHPNNCKGNCNDIKLSKIGTELNSFNFIIKISEVLQKADQTSDLNTLGEQAIVCNNILPQFVRAFEEKQGCPFERVLVSKEILRSADRNIWASCKLKPCAIESLIELQIIMETVEFIKNKERLMKGEPTFRSLLWYDDSLCGELFGGQSGYQQQSNFYPTFQRRLEYSPLSELQSYHTQLVEEFENTRWEDNSYYSFLKAKREIEECESAMKSNPCLSDFLLSVPYVCGANYGDTLEDLENARKTTMELINGSKSLQSVHLSSEKNDHLWVIIEIIATKIEFIKTCEEGNIKASLFGLEHIFFNAAKSLSWQEREKNFNEDLKGDKGCLINKTVLSKLYGTYEQIVEMFRSGNSNHAPEEHVPTKSSEEPYSCEKTDRKEEANCSIRNSLVLHLDIGYISKILDEAQSANLNKLQQLMCRCTEHLEILNKYFQILQEENVSSVVITKENVLGFMKTGGIRTVILKPEAIEVYTEMAMVYETVYFLKNSIASKVDKPRFRSLLWFDVSLLPEMFQCQEKMAPFSYRKDNLLEMIESSISELKGESEVIRDYAEKINCSYALRLLTRELDELSETKNLLQTSKSSISMCVDLVPYTISLNYGSTVSELECNYKQFSLLLEKLMLADTKDFGKMAHIMKIMKTIEHMKFVCIEQGKSPLPLVIYQMLKNWRKSCQLKKQDMRMSLDTNEKQSTKQSTSVSDPQISVHSQAQQKRPASVTSEDRLHAHEDKNDHHHSKKKKVVASLMTTTKKIHEKKTSRNLRKSANYNFPKGKELQLSSSKDNIWSKKPEDLRERSPVSPSPSEDSEVPCPLDCIHSPPNPSEPNLINSNMSASRQNLADLNDFNKNSKSCSQSAKQHDQECFAYCDEGDEGAFSSSAKVPLLQRLPNNFFSSAAKLGGSNSVLATLSESCDLKPDVPDGNASSLMSECSPAITLSSEPDRIGGHCEDKSVIPNCMPTHNPDSSAVMEVNQREYLCSEPSSLEHIKNSDDRSAFRQNEPAKEAPERQSSSAHTYGTIYPYYSWYYYQTGSNCHSITQTYQEISSYEAHHLTPSISTATSTVYNSHSNIFYSQTFSHFGFGDYQRFNVSQTYPIQSYVNSAVPFPYSCQHHPSWYTGCLF